MSGEAEELRGRIGALEATAAEARGGWKVLVFIAGAAGTCGSVIGWLVSHFTAKGGKILPLLLTLGLVGCATGPLKGGRASVSKSAQGIEQTVEQGENPAAVSRQDQETVRVRSYVVPAGSRLMSGSNSAVVVSAAMYVSEREETRAKTELGAAQKDTAREIGAKLASLKGLVWVGVVVFLFGLATMFYPPLRVIVGSVTTSAAIVAGGLALMILPTLIVGNELLILGCVGLAVGGWFLAHRYGKMRGFIDANKNGVDDREEGDAK